MELKGSITQIVLFLLLIAAIPATGQSTTETTLVLAKEDTFSFAASEFDTLLVSAERVSVEEIIKAIGERMERDTNLIQTHEYTELTTAIQRENSDPDCKDYTVYETATRHRSVRGQGTQTVELWDRERKYRKGEMVEEKIEDEEFQTQWGAVGENVRQAVPFTTDTGHKYKYQIEDRHLIGNNVVYRILFEPKNRFDTLPSGTVWVDFSDLVLRRIEARLTENVPFPIFLKSIPFLRLTQKKVGDFWVADEIHARIELRNVPMPDWPNNLELRVEIKDHVINGVSFNNDGTVKEMSTQGGGQ